MADKIYMGIDIGLHGAIVIMNGDEIEGKAMPLSGKSIDPQTIVAAMQYVKPDHVVFEKLGVIFGTSKATAFSMGYQCGVIETACVSLKIPYTMVPAKQWQKDIYTGIVEVKKSNGKRDTKAMALIACKRLFPNIDLTLTDRAKKPHDGYVDAILIAEWAKRNNL